ncbi:MAG TPA: hypothetical protein VM030_06540 [Acidimicrobiales bacterium]|nr:hypothetical protein [Acidimicrobiales bacterium]
MARKQCPSCSALVPADAMSCSECGWAPGRPAAPASAAPVATAPPAADPYFPPTAPAITQPMVSGAEAPFAAAPSSPGSDTIAVARPVGDGPAQWLHERAGERAVERPRPSLEVGTVGVGGAVAAMGVLTFAGGQLADSNLLAFLVAALLAGAGIALLLRGPEELRPAGVAMSGIAVPAAITFLLASGGEPNFTIVGLLSAVALLALYLVGPAPGHTFHLTMAVVSMWFLLIGLTEDSLGVGGGLPSIDSAFTMGGSISLVAGALFLGAAWWLDHNGLRAMATPFLTIGILAAAFGLFAIGAENGALIGGLLALVIGAALCIAASGGDRRGTMWAGLAFIGAGLLTIAGELAPDGDKGLVTMLVAVVLGGALAWFGPAGARWAEELGS